MLKLGSCSPPLSITFSDYAPGKNQHLVARLHLKLYPRCSWFYVETKKWTFLQSSDKCSMRNITSGWKQESAAKSLIITNTVRLFLQSVSQSVVCRGGRTGRWPRASKAGGHQKSEIAKMELRYVDDFSYCKATNTCCMDLIFRNLFLCQH